MIDVMYLLRLHDLKNKTVRADVISVNDVERVLETIVRVVNDRR